MKRKSILVAPVLAILLSTSLSAEQFSVSNLTLKQAIEEISKKSNMPYMVDGKLLDGKKSPNIKNIEGVENALDEILKGTNLKATIEDGTILVKEKAVGLGTVLEPISVNDSYLGSTTENSNSYTTGSMSTATKLDLSIRETPQSVKVLTREYLDDANITSYQELFDNITGVTTNRVDERIQPTARSFEVDYYLIDGIPSVMGLSERDPDLIIYDRVELVKGANGLMTGAGNPGLGINFIRKHANSKVFKGDINLSAGSWDDYSATLDIQTPLNSDGTIRARLVAKHQDSKSFLDHYEKQKDTFYGVVDMDLTDTTFLSLGASYEKLDRNWVKYVGLPAFYTDGTRTNFDRSTNISSDWTYWNSETTTIYAKATQYLYEDISLNINYLYKEYTPETALFFFSGEVDKQTSLGDGFFYLTSGDSKSKENNIDIYASIPFKLGGLDHEIVTGFMYNKNELVKRKLGTPVLSSKNLYFNNINIPLATPISNPRKGNLEETVQTGIYLAGKFSLMEDLKLITGLRVSDWEYKNKTTGAGNREFNNEITPYAGLVYDIDEHHSVYASYTDIFKTQTSKDINDQYLDPIVGKNYETGIKGEYFDKRLNTALSIFRVEQDGVATKDESGPNIVTGGTAFKAAKGVVSKGVEFDISGEITDNWNLSFGIVNFEAKDAQDKKFSTSSARTTANLFTKYKINKDFAIGGGLNYKSKIYSGSGATQITQDEYIIANVMASYDVTKDLKLQLNINNLFDKKYYSGIGSDNMHYGEPRSFTLGMKYTF